MRTEFQAVIRTGKLHQLQAADLALTEAGIPHYLQEELVSGMVTAMPVDPSPGPGTWWAILVPVDHVGNAQAVVENLPFTFTTRPDVWDCAPSEKGKRIISFGIWAAIAAIVIIIVAALAKEYHGRVGNPHPPGVESIMAFQTLTQIRSSPPRWGCLFSLS